MKEYDGPSGTECDEEIDSLIAAARQNREQTFTDLNGVKLVADPAVQAIRPDYVGELRWTFWHLLNDKPIMTATLGERDEWHNVVPELEVLCTQLMEEFETLDRDNPREVLTWFVRLTAITWCKGVMSDRQKAYVRNSLESHKECRGSHRVSDNYEPVDHRLLGYHHIKMAMGALTPYFVLTEGWLENAQAWLANEA